MIIEWAFIVTGFWLIIPSNLPAAITLPEKVSPPTIAPEKAVKRAKVSILLPCSNKRIKETINDDPHQTH